MFQNVPTMLFIYLLFFLQEEVLKRKTQEYKTLGENIHSVESELLKLGQNLDAKTVSYEAAKEEREKLDILKNELKQKLDEFDVKLENLLKIGISFCSRSFDRNFVQILNKFR